MLRALMSNRLLHPRGPRGDLEPTFAVAVQTIDPVLAISRRLAGSRQALIFREAGAASAGAALNKAAKGFEDAGDVDRPAIRTKDAKENRK